GSSALAPLYDGAAIQPTGNLDTAYLNEPDVSAEIARIEDLPAAQQTAPWMALDKMIMTRYAPVVPLYLSQAFYLYGSKLGGVFESSILGFPDFVNAYVKQ
ncbi:MAG TPA: ABC transporter substrate-binding protein, partial [Micromonosporaceae bacterium]